MEGDAQLTLLINHHQQELFSCSPTGKDKQV